MSSWIDVTRPIDDRLVTWPGRARPQHRWEKRIDAGAVCNVSFWEWNAHTGTHMDAPLHFIDSGRAIDEIPPDVFMGDCRVIASEKVLTEEEVKDYLGTRRLLIKSAHSRLREDSAYEPHEALMTRGAAALLIQHGLVLLGTDRLSVDDSRSENFDVHHRILGGSAVIVEGLLLTAIDPGFYYLSAAPLRLEGTEASPVRAFLKPDDAAAPGRSKMRA